MGEKVGKEKVKVEEGYLYYVGKDGHVWASPMRHNKHGRKKKVGKEKINKESGYLYYVKNGYVYRAKMKNASSKKSTSSKATKPKRKCKKKKK